MFFFALTDFFSKKCAAFIIKQNSLYLCFASCSLPKLKVGLCEFTYLIQHRHSSSSVLLWAFLTFAKLEKVKCVKAPHRHLSYHCPLFQSHRKSLIVCWVTCSTDFVLGHCISKPIEFQKKKISHHSSVPTIVKNIHNFLSHVGLVCNCVIMFCDCDLEYNKHVQFLSNWFVGFTWFQWTFREWSPYFTQRKHFSVQMWHMGVGGERDLRGFHVYTDDSHLGCACLRCHLRNWLMLCNTWRDFGMN